MIATVMMPIVAMAGNVDRDMIQRFERKIKPAHATVRGLDMCMQGRRLPNAQRPGDGGADPGFGTATGC